MNAAFIICDADVLIGYLRGHAPSVAFLDSQGSDQPVRTHAIAAAEVVCGARDAKDMRHIVRFLNQFEIEFPNDADFVLGMKLIKTHRLSHGVGWADAVIAATCLRLGSTLATANRKHFRVIPSLKVLTP